MGEPQVVVLGHEARRGGGLGIRERGVGEVEQLAAALVAEGREPRPEALERGAKAGQARPRRRVGDRCRAERGQVPEQEIVDGRFAVERPAEPGVGRRERHARAPTPQAAGRHLDGGDEHHARVRERGGVLLREACSQRLPQLLERERPLLQALAAERDDGCEVDAAQRGREVTVAPDEGVEDGLHERAQAEAVGGGDEVERAAHDADSHRLAGEQRRLELRRLEALDPRAERDVVVARHLRLQADEVVDHVERRPFDPLEQELTRERRAIQRPIGEDVAQRPVVEKCW